MSKTDAVGSELSSEDPQSSEPFATTRSRRRSVAERAVLLLRVLGEDGELSAAEIGRQTGLPGTTVRRLLSELIGSGAVTRVAAGYVVSDSLVGALSRRDAELRAQLALTLTPFMLELHLRTGLPAHAAILERGRVRVIGSVFDHDHRVRGWRGNGVPTPDSLISLGLLAFTQSAGSGLAVAQRRRLEQLRNRGVAAEAGVDFAVVAPVRTPPHLPSAVLYLAGRQAISAVQVERAGAILRQISLAATRSVAQAASCQPATRPTPQAVRSRFRTWP